MLPLLTQAFVEQCVRALAFVLEALDIAEAFPLYAARLSELDAGLTRRIGVVRAIRCIEVARAIRLIALLGLFIRIR
jgi:hypothetical protein